MRTITYPTYFRADGYRTLIKMTATNSTIRESNILLGGFSYDNRMVEGDGFQVGTAIAAEVQVVLDNTNNLYNKSFLGKEYAIQLAAIKTNGTEQEGSLPSNRWFKLGTFIVVDVDLSNANSVTMTLQDRMVLMDKAIPSFTLGTLYANLTSFCSTLGITWVGNVSRVQALKKFDVITTDNENGITYRDFVRGCALLLGANAYMNDVTLDFRTFNTTSTSLGPSQRYSSRLMEKYKIGGVQVVDEEGTTLWSRNTSNTDNCRIVIAPDTSVVIDLLGGIQTVASVYNTIYTQSQTSYYPPAFEALPKEYYPCEMTAMNWWEIEPGDVITYTDKSGNSYSTIVTSCASIANGKTSITSTADEEERQVPSQTDAVRTTTMVARSASDAASVAYSTAVTALPKYGSNTQTGSTQAKTVTISEFPTTLTQGQRISVLFTNKNTATSPTLNVSSTGAKPIVTSDGQSITADNVNEVGWPANSLVSFIFDGTNWRIDDAAALTKIDHILTEDIVGESGWINLKKGEFVFTDSDTGDSIGFNDGALSMTGTVNATGGTISGDMTVTGVLEGATIEGSEMSIRATGDITNTNLEYEDEIVTSTAGTFGDNPIRYKAISLQATSKDKTTQAINNNTSIALDPYLGRVSITGEDKISFSLREPGQSYYQEKMALSKTQSNAIELSVNGNLSAKPKSISRTIISVTGVSVGSLQVYSTAGLAMVTLELTLTGALSDWTTIASGLPDAAFDWYDTASSWGASFTRNMRVHVDTYGYLEIRYGAATSYRISFSYPLA